MAESLDREYEPTLPQKPKEVDENYNFLSYVLLELRLQQEGESSQVPTMCSRFVREVENSNPVSGLR